MPSRRSRLILGVLLVLVVASLWRTVAVEREKRRLNASYDQAQQMVRQLETERAHLSTELGEARQTIEGQAGDLTGLQGELEQVQTKLNQTVAEIASLQKEHEQLRRENTSLSAQLGSVITEKQQLEAKLSSLKELKVAIRDVKRKIWNERWAAWRGRIEALREADQERLAAGNRGYLVRNGVSTLGARTKLQVHVLEPQTQ